MASLRSKSSRISLPWGVGWGLAAGIGIGILAGEWCKPLAIVGDIYIGLLQMTVLPYVVISLIVNLGRLNGAMFGRLAWAASVVIGILWVLMAIVLMTLPLAFPAWQSGNFFSVGMLSSPPPPDFVGMFIPANPFQALAENVVPAAVLFSICVGVGLMGVENKQPLLDNLQVLLRALSSINHFVARLSPLGVFAIMAATAGTIRVDELARLQAYVLVQLAGAVFVGLVLLPLLVATLTPITYWGFLRAVGSPLLLALATGKTMVVLPMIAERSAQLLLPFQREGLPQVEPEALVSLGYPFPHLGKLLALLFIPFSAWFVGAPLAWSDYPGFLGAGYLAMFGNALTGIPFLLDLVRLPSDMFHLFVASGVICGRISDGLGVCSLLAFTLLTTFLVQRRWTIWVPVALFRIGFAAGVLVLCILGMRAVLEPVVKSMPSKEQVLLGMHTAVVSAPQREWTSLPPSEPAEPERSRLQRIRTRGAIRVGYLPDSLPFAFRNEDDQLVGFDIDMAHLLASELQCQLWLVPLTPDQVVSALERDEIDLVMSGMAMTTDRLELARFSQPYLRVTMSLVVPDFRRSEFDEVATVQRMPRLRIATLPSRRFTEELNRLFPQADVVTIPAAREFFENSELGADALLLSAESGSAWSLIYPGFTPVVPAPYERRLPLGYPVAAWDDDFAQFVSQWIELKVDTPEFHRLYDYWILGRTGESKQPRWSILRNVLGWAR